MAKRPKYTESDFPVPGTVFIAATADGRFAAGRVLQRAVEGGAQAALIAATPWLGNEMPRLDSRVLRDTLVLSHHSWRDHPERFWVWEPMPKEFQVLGQIELSPEDVAASSNSFGGWHGVPIQAQLQKAVGS